MATVYLDLLMDTGETTRIECNSKYEDDLHEAITNAMKRRDWWSPRMFDGCRAEYLGTQLDRVNMGRVIGSL